MDYRTRASRVAITNRAAPLLSTKTAFMMFFFELTAFWGAVSLLFYLEIPS